MISFPNAKINIGLNILQKRKDGFHDIESLFYPIPLSDIIEFVEPSETFSFENTGISIDAPMEKNLVVKAYLLLKNEFHLPNIKIILHKRIPFGAGLGGGSADAAFMLKMLNSHFQLQLSQEDLKQYAAQIGSDCSFFIQNQPCIATSKGEILTANSLDLSTKWLLLVKPPVGVSTMEAYSLVQPNIPSRSLAYFLDQPIESWQETVKNDFEVSVFPKYPIISEIKNSIRELGALYTSMSGSGSSVFGIFSGKPKIESVQKKYSNCFFWLHQL